MKLDEILDKPLPYEVIADDANFRAKFKAGDRQIVFDAENEHLLSGEDDEGEWTLSFVELRPDPRDKNKKLVRGVQDFGISGSGREFDVFATLRAILTEVIKRYNPKKFAFSASKSDRNRARLYQRLFSKFLSGWTMERETIDGNAFFTMVREALDSPLPYTVTNRSPKFFDAEFKAGDRMIEFIAQYSGGSFWEVSFEEKQIRSATTKLTGSGNEFQVFATVKKIIDEFIADYKPVRITMDSFKGEPNRAKLYQRMIKKNLPAGWKMDRDDKHPSYTTFTMVKEGMMKRSDPYISGEKPGVRSPDLMGAPRRPTANRSKLETLQKKSGKSMEKVEAAWNRAAAETPAGPKKWANVMIRAKADLGVGA